MPNTTYECNTPDVVFENFGDEVILLNLKSGRYFSLDPIGIAGWDYLSRQVPLRSAIEGIGSAFPSESSDRIAADLQRLLEEFIAEELLRRSSLSPAAASIASPAKLPAAYASPSLLKFDDVADMLMLDPVHDVSEVGWPHPPTPTPAQHD
jgi:hypothetical protein